jgi:DNA-binding MarR family transcriptional regulator
MNLKAPNKTAERIMSKIEKVNVTTKEVEYSLKDIDDKILLNLRDLGMRLRFLYDGKDSQRRALILLLKSGSMSQRELTERLSIKPGSMSEVLAKLENKGMIEKTPLETDKRTAMVSLTEQGTATALEAMEYRMEKRVEMFSSLDDDEKITLLLLLERINDTNL